jgi:hypothetical protein
MSSSKTDASLFNMIAGIGQAIMTGVTGIGKSIVSGVSGVVTPTYLPVSQYDQKICSVEQDFKKILDNLPNIEAPKHSLDFSKLLMENEVARHFEDVKKTICPPSGSVKPISVSLLQSSGTGSVAAAATAEPVSAIPHFKHIPYSSLLRWNTIMIDKDKRKQFNVIDTHLVNYNEPPIFKKYAEMELEFIFLEIDVNKGYIDFLNTSATILTMEMSRVCTLLDNKIEKGANIFSTSQRTKIGKAYRLLYELFDVVNSGGSRHIYRQDQGGQGRDIFNANDKPIVQAAYEALLPPPGRKACDQYECVQTAKNKLESLKLPENKWDRFEVSVQHKIEKTLTLLRSINSKYETEHMLIKEKILKSGVIDQNIKKLNKFYDNVDSYLDTYTSACLHIKDIQAHPWLFSDKNGFFSGSAPESVRFESYLRSVAQSTPLCGPAYAMIKSIPPSSINIQYDDMWNDEDTFPLYEKTYERVCLGPTTNHQYKARLINKSNTEYKYETTMLQQAYPCDHISPITRQELIEKKQFIKPYNNLSNIIYLNGKTNRKYEQILLECKKIDPPGETLTPKEYLERQRKIIHRFLNRLSESLNQLVKYYDYLFDVYTNDSFKKELYKEREVEYNKLTGSCVYRYKWMTCLPTFEIDKTTSRLKFIFPPTPFYISFLRLIANSRINPRVLSNKQLSICIATEAPNGGNLPSFSPTNNSTVSIQYASYSPTMYFNSASATAATAVKANATTAATTTGSIAANKRLDTVFKLNKYVSKFASKNPREYLTVLPMMNEDEITDKMLYDFIAEERKQLERTITEAESKLVQTQSEFERLQQIHIRAVEIIRRAQSQQRDTPSPQSVASMIRAAQVPDTPSFQSTASPSVSYKPGRNFNKQKYKKTLFISKHKGGDRELDIAIKVFTITQVNIIDQQFKIRQIQSRLTQLRNQLRSIPNEAFNRNIRNYPLLERIESSGNMNDCLIHTLLTALCPPFRRLHDFEKNIVANKIRREEFPKLIGLPARTPLDQDDVVDLQSNNFLDDGILRKLLCIYKMNGLIWNGISITSLDIDIGTTTRVTPEKAIMIRNTGELQARKIKKLNPQDLRSEAEIALGLPLHFEPIRKNRRLDRSSNPFLFTKEQVETLIDETPCGMYGDLIRLNEVNYTLYRTVRDDGGECSAKVLDHPSTKIQWTSSHIELHETTIGNCYDRLEIAPDGTPTSTYMGHFISVANDIVTFEKGTFTYDKSRHRFLERTPCATATATTSANPLTPNTWILFPGYLLLVGTPSATEPTGIMFTHIERLQTERHLTGLYGIQNTPIQREVLISIKTDTPGTIRRIGDTLICQLQYEPVGINFVSTVDPIEFCYMVNV